MSTARRMTPAEVDAAAARLAPRARAKGLPPMNTGDALDGMAEELRLALADLWTLRDSIDAELGGRPDHAMAVEHLRMLADSYAETLDHLRDLAAVVGHVIPLDRPDTDPW